MKLRESDIPKIRKCLKCRKGFLSEWSGNRSCKQCLSRNPTHHRHVNMPNHTNNMNTETGRRINKHGGLGQ